MFKKFYTQLSAAALLFCVATTGAFAAHPESKINPSTVKEAGTVSMAVSLPDGNVKPSKAVTAAPPVDEPAVQLPDTSYLIKEIIVSSGIKRKNVSPLRLVDIDEKTIAIQAAGKTYPELLKDIPGIYATAETGSYGDAKINIRGFKQENISVLLNGIPISGLTSGSMYWNNWMGLTDATANIQVQKGVGGSMLSDNSVGGSINIVTKSPGLKPSYGVGYNYATGGTSKAFVNYNSGVLGNGWGISFMVSKVWGTSWVECTDVNSWSYLASISKKINKKHSLLFTAMGSPEQHNQRSARLTYKEVEQYGREYSKNWGYITLPDGTREARSISRNNYHKPYFTLNHYYNTVGANGRKFSLNNAVYMALAHGGGYWTETKGKSIVAHQKEGHVDWDAVVAGNREAYANGKTEKERSAQNALSDYIAGHTQIGAKSAFDLELSEKFTWGGGVHYQGYFTWEKEQIKDLLGGEYWYEDYATKSLAGLAGRNPIKRVGDYIRTNNGKNTHFGTLYSSLSYKSPAWNVELGASLNGSTTQRWDDYNYTGDIYSDWATGIGGAVKAGALYRVGAGKSNASSATSLYANGAYYSRVPYSSVFFASGNNQISEDVKNEQNYLGELGFRTVLNRVGVEATFYASYWKNKSIMSSPYKQHESEDAVKYMITGLDAFHYGVELDAYYNFTRWGKLSGYASIGKWEWKNDVKANIYDNYTGQIAQTINVYSNGLPVGDAPQTQIGATLMLKPIGALSGYSTVDPSGTISYAKSGELTVQIGWNYNARYWADFEPNTRTNVNDRTEPYRIPNYNLFNIGLNYQRHFIIGGKAVGANLFFNLNNVFDVWYIERGKDGADHTLETFTGYWGQGRNCTFGVRFTL